MSEEEFPGNPRTGDLFADFLAEPQEVAGDWPPADRFPLNVAGRSVRRRVVADLADADSPLIVTGYAGLEQLIRLEGDLGEARHLRILFGNEPSAGEGGCRSLHPPSLPEEVEQYWLDQGVSLYLSARLIHFRERVRNGCVEARYWPGTQQRPLHAKLYLGRDAVTLGSSNFSASGLEGQHEANARFTAASEPRRYRESAALAEQYWSLGCDYTEGLLALLDRLLSVVGWRDALARACGELLEGEWARGFLRQMDREAFQALWPAQRQGIAQALYLLDRQGAVLIADATGSGKTRMGAHLLRAQQARIQGTKGLPRALMLAPSAVVEEWERELSQADSVVAVFSQGLLSRGGRKSWRLEESRRRARLLAVDECHNFHNPLSRRTRSLHNHLADDVVLFTATPINRNVDDLIRVADLLGADNLRQSTLDALGRLRRTGRHLALGEEEVTQLREEIRTFTVRRTKRMLNTLIDREPENYRDHVGRICRYPEHRSYSYLLNEPESDRRRAAWIRQRLTELYGVMQIPATLQVSSVQRNRGLNEDRYRDNLLVVARKLVEHRILAALRSSRAALVEHLCGTEVARSEFGLGRYTKGSDTGDVLGRLAAPGPPPKNKLTVPLPEWLTEPDGWNAAHAHDHRILSEVLEEVRRMSPAREQAKAAHLASLAKRHERVLAFDSWLITIAVLRDELERLVPGLEILQATGGDGRDRQAVLRAFRPGEEQGAGVALCSDSLSEGVNLQAASALVHLDMPSVIRTAEQRTGRVDRLDSPHAEVEVWWPRDAEEFSLGADSRFKERVEAVTDLLGTNLPLPDELRNTARMSVDADTLVSEYERDARSADEAEPEDAFAGVRGLVEGEAALVGPDIYEYYRQRSVKVLSRVSVVVSESTWAFFCLAGTAERSPRWFFFSDPDAEPLAALDKVSLELRRRLSEDPPIGEIDEPASQWLKHFARRLPEAERAQLPLRKQRALQEMKRVVDGLCHHAASQQAQERLDSYLRLRELFDHSVDDPEQSEPDWEAVAHRWLDLIRPYWYQRLTQDRRALLRLRDLRQDLIEAEPEFGPQVLEAFSTLPLHNAAEHRVVAAILGVPDR